jgi:glycosyltransferase involved in cell wall biosynthesis
VRVLLLSPIAGRDPLSGDTSYTDALLADSPVGVGYVRYDQALADGSLRIRGRKGASGDAGWLALRGAELALRRAGVMFREPTWFVTVDRSYDLVHTHLFNVRQVDSTVPIVSSYGYPLQEHYRHRERWSERRLATAVAAERAWARLARIHVPWLHQVAPSVMTGYSPAAQGWLIGQGAAAATVRQASTGLGPLTFGPRTSSGTSLLFAGRDFERKGGHVALEAFSLLRRRVPDARLTVVTGADVAPPPLPAGVTWRADVDRPRMLAEVLPAADVMLLPTAMDCGVPYTVLEALQAEVPVVLTELRWLDDRLRGPGVVKVPRTPEAFAAAAEALLEPGALAEAGKNAHTLWEEHFTMKMLGEDLVRAYLQALSQ